MKASCLCFVLVLVLVAGEAAAIDTVLTGGKRVSQTQCSTPAPTPTTAPATAGEPQDSTLHSGAPGASAQIGQATLVDISSSVGEAAIKPVHYFQKKMKQESYEVQVPVPYTYKEPYVEQKTVPVTKTGITQTTKHIKVPVTKYREVKTPVYDRCGKICGYDCQKVPYTAYETKLIQEPKAYTYTENEIQSEVKEREKTGIRYEAATRERWLETTEVATKYVKFQTITTTYTVQQTAVSEVPASEVATKP